MGLDCDTTSATGARASLYSDEKRNEQSQHWYSEVLPCHNDGWEMLNTRTEDKKFDDAPKRDESKPSKNELSDVVEGFISPVSGGIADHRKTGINSEFGTLPDIVERHDPTNSQEKSPEHTNNSNPTPDQGNNVAAMSSRNSVSTTQHGRCSCNEEKLIHNLQQENKYLQGELEKYSSAFQHGQRQLKLARQELENLQKECVRLEKERHDAVHDKQQLLCTIQGAVVERTAGGTGANQFPTGDDITSKFEEYSDETFYLLKDLVRALLDNHQTADVSSAVQRAELDLQRCYATSKKVANQVVAIKKTQFETFVGHPIHKPNNTLIDLMWQSTMQEYVKKMIDNGMNGIFSRQSDDHWAAYLSKDLYDNGEINSTSVLGFCKSILYLNLVCRFSKPRCFLFPDIGTTERFDRKYHKQIYLGLKGETKVKEGDIVKVYFPGLYFVSPDVGAEKPKICALVAHQSNYTVNYIDFE